MDLQVNKCSCPDMHPSAETAGLCPHAQLTAQAAGQGAHKAQHTRQEGPGQSRSPRLQWHSEEQQAWPR